MQTAQAALAAQASATAAAATQAPAALMSTTALTAQLPPLVFSDMSNWDNEPVPNREWAVIDRIPLRQTTLLSGEGGAGKSYVTLHLCVAHLSDGATGKLFRVDTRRFTAYRHLDVASGA